MVFRCPAVQASVTRPQLRTTSRGRSSPRQASVTTAAPTYNSTTSRWSRGGATSGKRARKMAISIAPDHIDWMNRLCAKCRCGADHRQCAGRTEASHSSRLVRPRCVGGAHRDQCCHPVPRPEPQGRTSPIRGCEPEEAMIGRLETDPNRSTSQRTTNPVC